MQPCLPSWTVPRQTQSRAQKRHRRHQIYSTVSTPRRWPLKEKIAAQVYPTTQGRQRRHRDAPHTTTQSPMLEWHKDRPPAGGTEWRATKRGAPIPVLPHPPPPRTRHTPLAQWDAKMMPTMTPKRPRAEPKISTIRILTKRVPFWASARAHELPVTPTHSLGGGREAGDGAEPRTTARTKKEQPSREESPNREIRCT